MRRVATGVAAAGLLLLASACGNDAGSASSGEGKAVFTSAGCGNCHTLRDAGTTATVGPDLDERKPSAEKAEAVVRVGIQGTMPAFEGQLSDDEIEAVAAYVSESAGGADAG
ncbi:MAG TPA: cytochrome c [Acidimicrobiales bacterium]